jgi:tetratricopeptide (TPR) repeat protein
MRRIPKSVPWFFLVAASLVAAPAARADDPPAPSPAAGGASKPPLDLALEHFEAGRFAEASTEADRVGADDPAYARARYLTGEVHLTLGEHAAAEAAFRAGLEKKPASSPLLLGVGRALHAQQKDAEALPFVEKAVAADPKSARARATLGTVRAATGKKDEGRKDLAAAQKLDPADSDVARAVVEERIGAEDLPGAQRAAASFAKARKDSPMGPFLLALVDDRAKRVDEAITGYEKAIAMDDRFLDAHKDLAILCVSQNPLYQDAVRTKKAAAHFQKYEDLGGKDQKVLEIWHTLQQFLGAPARKDGG